MKKLKGQYLAVETVFTFGLGLMVAIGVITLFDNYKTEVLTASEANQVEIINSEILLAMDAFKQVDEGGKIGNGRYQVDLPDNIAGKSYFVKLEDRLVIEVGSESYSTKPEGFDGYNLRGSVEGGDLTIFKEGNNFTVRAQ